MYIPVVIHKDTNSDYGVTIPDIPGCYSAGTSVASALKNAKEAIIFHIEGLLEDGELPNFKFREIDDIVHLDEYQGGFFSLVEVDLSDLTVEAIRFNVSWPKYILATLDNYLKETHETRSGYLAKLVLQDLRKNRSIYE
ncbi:type II toxin-antitoxin system HicB family antitoxin [Thorsellia anophelis]|uniref:Predicted nuclease of the RNAse H fold, HicB family n=1 Tax=Thorsellia anophelis DSM 18579 TaxID=1123402 RepID=A0A1H9YDV8_9GAMM|nr:type II toxin-antitoxin system HicB family antitoxin [Thorsellia anophelis]SES67156.1 Predicted nuclease of the RNAse H fold, HicB family [Thorsellia anophelis DSM 18579]